MSVIRRDCLLFDVSTQDGIPAVLPKTRVYVCSMKYDHLKDHLNRTTTSDRTNRTCKKLCYMFIRPNSV